MRFGIAWLLAIAWLGACGCASLKERVANRIEYILPVQSATPGSVVQFNFKLPPEISTGRVVFLNRNFHVFHRQDLQENIHTAFLSIPDQTPAGDYPILCSFSLKGLADKIEESFTFHIQPGPPVLAAEQVKAAGFDPEALQADYVLIQKAVKKASHPSERPPVLILPQSGRLAAVYGTVRKYPKGEITLAGVEIEPVTSGILDVAAAADGKVLLSQNLPMLGSTIVLDHGLSFATLYAHLDHSGVSEGQAVKRGQILGRVGKTGKAAVGTRLLYQLFVEGVPVDPLKYTETNVFK